QPIDHACERFSPVAASPVAFLADENSDVGNGVVLINVRSNGSYDALRWLLQADRPIVVGRVCKRLEIGTRGLVRMPAMSIVAVAHDLGVVEPFHDSAPQMAFGEGFEDKSRGIDRFDHRGKPISRLSMNSTIFKIGSRFTLLEFVERKGARTALLSCSRVKTMRVSPSITLGDQPRSHSLGTTDSVGRPAIAASINKMDDMPSTKSEAHISS